MKTESEHMPLPKLGDDIKALNGKSGHKLLKCIDTLCEILDEEPKQSLPQKQVGDEG